jgi:hypothetical protein
MEAIRYRSLSLLIIAHTGPIWLSLHSSLYAQ